MSSQPAPVIVLDFAGLTPSLNPWTRLHWRKRRDLIAEWRIKVEAAAIRSRSQPLTPPEKGKRWVIVARARSIRRRDSSNCIGPCNKLVTDHLRRRERIKVSGKFQWFPTVLPILWDDDADHCEELWIWTKANTKTEERLRVEVWQAEDWAAREDS